ncbi:UDP-N-acetylmuramate--L-alanine ligase [Patescibacteria group bacterium AH-259-L07]|nr:UDP-N-acetylmuramate--L-alanine ligase [Patescibacteria group bacterium AH-259-L07]
MVNWNNVIVSEFRNSDTTGRGSGKRSFPACVAEATSARRRPVGVTGANPSPSTLGEGMSHARGRKPYGEHSSRALASDYVRKVHCIGIGGIGVSAVAKLLQSQGKIVSGSDLYESDITKELGELYIPVFFKHRKENISEDTDLVIYSPAVSENNPERQRAKELGISQFSYPEFLGVLSKEKNTIAITGTNGKSTTTALCGLMLEKAGLDPTVIVGSKVFLWDGNVRVGKSNLPAGRQGIFVVEACEHQANMLHLDPNIIVLTNLEKDHLDYYKDLNHIIDSFQEFIQKLPKDGVLILNSDDINLSKLKPQSNVITYGIKNKADVMAKNIVVSDMRQRFDLTLKGPTFKSRRISLKVPGIFNIYNVLAVITAALHLGVDMRVIIKAVEEFHGIWRRFENIPLRLPASRWKPGVLPIIISDYAHHPTAVYGTIQAAKEFYPDRRIVAVFQPHHHNRTKKLFNDFVQSFTGSDVTIISKIYDVAGREEGNDQDVSSYDLVTAIKEKYPDKSIIYTKDLKQTKELIKDIIQPNDLILIMGAGDIDTVARELVN